MYKIITIDGKAKRAEFTTVHGTVQTPVFMNVGTAAAIKGAVSTQDLEEIGTQIELSNTYHLHVRPGDEVVKQLGGLHRFMSWNRPILTVPCGRTADFYGAGGEHEDPVQPGFYDRHGL